jgi:hypothetical protein
MEAGSGPCGHGSPHHEFLESWRSEADCTPSDLFIKVCDTQIDAAWYETRKVCGCATKFKSPASVEAA